MWGAMFLKSRLQTVRGLALYVLDVSFCFLVLHSGSIWVPFWVPFWVYLFIEIRLVTENSPYGGLKVNVSEPQWYPFSLLILGSPY